MRSIEQELTEILKSQEETPLTKSLSDAAKMFDDLVKTGVATKRGNRLATETMVSDSYIVFNK